MPSSVKPKVIYPPAGVSREIFDQIIEASVLHAGLAVSTRDQGLDLDVDTIRAYCPRIPKPVITKVIESKPYHQVLILRGIKQPGSKDGLSADQMRALTILTDVSSSRSLEKRLKLAGISWFRWQAWLNDPIFRAAHDKLCEDIFKKAQSSIDVQVVSGALDGKLDFIKYANEMSGRFDPNRRAHADVQLILNGIVEIITRNVTDPEVLKRISSELSAVVAKLG
jgi:hypothetical protein